MASSVDRSIGSVLELVHLFRVFRFFESFVHHITDAV